MITWFDNSEHLLIFSLLDHLIKKKIWKTVGTLRGLNIIIYSVGWYCFVLVQIRKLLIAANVFSFLICIFFKSCHVFCDTECVFYILLYWDIETMTHFCDKSWENDKDQFRNFSPTDRLNYALLCVHTYIIKKKKSIFVGKIPLTVYCTLFEFDHKSKIISFAGNAHEGRYFKMLD